VSRQLTLSGEHNFFTRAKQPFFAASSRAASPLSRSWISVSPSLTRSRGVFPSLFFFVGSAPCCAHQKKGGKYVSRINTLHLRHLMPYWANTLTHTRILQSTFHCLFEKGQHSCEQYPFYWKPTFSYTNLETTKHKPASQRSPITFQTEQDWGQVKSKKEKKVTSLQHI